MWLALFRGLGFAERKAGTKLDAHTLYSIHGNRAAEKMHPDAEIVLPADLHSTSKLIAATLELRFGDRSGDEEMNLSRDFLCTQKCVYQRNGNSALRDDLRSTEPPSALKSAREPDSKKVNLTPSHVLRDAVVCTSMEPALALRECPQTKAVARPYKIRLFSSRK